MEKVTFRLDNYQPLFPMIYLILAAAIAVVGTKFELPPEVTGMLVGAALTSFL